MIKGLSEAAARRIVAARTEAPFTGVDGPDSSRGTRQARISTSSPRPAH
jgi:hypothetical protein